MTKNLFTKQNLEKLDVLEITNYILELKMLKPQTQESKITIQKLQQRLTILTREEDDTPS